jgi:hypothetical protein
MKEYSSWSAPNRLCSLNVIRNDKACEPLEPAEQVLKLGSELGLQEADGERRKTTHQTTAGKARNYGADVEP